MPGSDPAAVEDDAAGAVEEAAEEGPGAADVGVRSLRRRHNQDISLYMNWSRCLCCSVPGRIFKGVCLGKARGREVIRGVSDESKRKRRLCVCVCVCVEEGSGVYVASEPIRSNA